MIRRSILGSACLTAGMMLLVGVSPALAQKGGQTVDSDKLGPGTYTGTLLSAPTPGGTFTLRIETPKVQAPRQGGQTAANVRNLVSQQQQMARVQYQMARLQQQMARARTPQERARIMQQVQRQMQQQRVRMVQQQIRNTQQAVRTAKSSTGKVAMTNTDVDFQASAAVVVRSLQLPVAFDEKGNLKEYTTEEKLKLKGSNPRLPGYESKPEDLHAGQIVQVTLLPSGKAPAAGKDLDVGLAAKRMQVAQIVIVQEGSSPDPKKK